MRATSDGVSWRNAVKNATMRRRSAMRMMRDSMAMLDARKVDSACCWCRDACRGLGQAVAQW